MDGDGVATISPGRKVDGERLAHDLQERCEQLRSGDGELVLDLSSVRRVDSAGVAAIDRLAARADEMAVKVVLRGVNVEVYRVLKLLKLAPRFSFLT